MCWINTCSCYNSAFKLKIQWTVKHGIFFEEFKLRSFHIPNSHDAAALHVLKAIQCQAFFYVMLADGHKTLVVLITDLWSNNHHINIKKSWNSKKAKLQGEHSFS